MKDIFVARTHFNLACYLAGSDWSLLGPLKKLSYLLSGSLLLIVACSGNLRAQELPIDPQGSLPEYAAMQVFESWQTLHGAQAEIDSKTRELIALAVSAQLPCDHCVRALSKRLLTEYGASQSELNEVVALAGYVRILRTLFNGVSYNLSGVNSGFDGSVSELPVETGTPGIERNLNKYLMPK